MDNEVLKSFNRRAFLRTVPAGAAAGFAIANTSLFSQVAAAQAQTAGGGASFQMLTAQQIQEDEKALLANPGNNNVVQAKTFTVVMTTETAKTGAEYEWHEGRDHVFQILEGETVYEVGGTPKGAHSIGPGEWHAPEAEGTTRFTLKKGDMLVVPRGTLHKRSTASSVTFWLISPQGNS
ncbi:MAG TPA: hypothetical protein VGG45_15625 [Terracidiphilus sp.]|jgi:quercetin dioxygenase-like cupin family protein